MENTLRSKTLTASLPGDPRKTYDWISQTENLPRWCGSITRSAPTHFIREDRLLLLDIVLTLGSVKLMMAIRLLANGDGSEIVMTLIQPLGLSDADFDVFIRGAENALIELQNIQGGQPAAPALPDFVAPVIEPTPAAPVTGRKLFVGNLPFSWTDEPLRDLFAAHGTVVSAVIARLRGRGGRSRGFGFVEMSTEVEAQTAIQKLHEGLAGERKMIVRLARSQESRPEDAAGQNAAPENAPASRPGGGRPRGRGQQQSQQPRHPRGPQVNRNRNAPRNDRGPRRETGISNNSGYEIFPRDGKGGFETEPTPRSAASPYPSSIESSPYMDDTGDVENRGPRPPRHRGRRSGPGH